jgi:hypothetical protein
MQSPGLLWSHRTTIDTGSPATVTSAGNTCVTFGGTGFDEDELPSNADPVLYLMADVSAPALPAPHQSNRC